MIFGFAPINSLFLCVFNFIIFLNGMEMILTINWCLMLGFSKKWNPTHPVHFEPCDGGLDVASGRIFYVLVSFSFSLDFFSMCLVRNFPFQS